ncbi:MAG: hypothetical protein E7549_06745 [Ruminococcaceae bacterium]|nr:hypothetical protein [Oscillospiraceae bacterium]
MKQWIAFLLCLWLLTLGAFSVAADSTTATVGGDVTQTEIITQTTVYYEEVEVEILEKVQSPYPDGTALVCIIVGGVFILVAVALVCIYLFAFPRWGLVKSEDAVAQENAATEENTDEEGTDGEEASSTVSLEDLF